ncbi:unnamed protein product [Prorocentrum cordatum]|uniref:Uncharacterized protein n=1 Tax=Prorocentrum cordatum TaxID=2364126 RepID=A0ABN9Y3X9_9DINO|nr:unnamed protein product [Polarella glacialis]
MRTLRPSRHSLLQQQRSWLTFRRRLDWCVWRLEPPRSSCSGRCTRWFRLVCQPASSTQMWSMTNPSCSLFMASPHFLEYQRLYEEQCKAWRCLSGTWATFTDCAELELVRFLGVEAKSLGYPGRRMRSSWAPVSDRLQVCSGRMCLFHAVAVFVQVTSNLEVAGNQATVLNISFDRQRGLVAGMPRSRSIPFMRSTSASYATLAWR